MVANPILPPDYTEKSATHHSPFSMFVNIFTMFTHHTFTHTAHIKHFYSEYYCNLADAIKSDT